MLGGGRKVEKSTQLIVCYVEEMCINYQWGF